MRITIEVQTWKKDSRSGAMEVDSPCRSKSRVDDDVGTKNIPLSKTFALTQATSRCFCVLWLKIEQLTIAIHNGRPIVRPGQA